MENENIKILIQGGSVCFFGDWFGRPYDNFHEIKSTEYKNNILTIEFCGGEHLLVYFPQNIRNEKKEFFIESASKVEWIYTPYGAAYRDIVKCVYVIDKDKIIKQTKYGKQIIKAKAPYAAVYIG